MGLCRALEQLRKPIRFDVLVGDGLSAQEHPASVTRTVRDGWSTAMSGHAMRGGRHFVEFETTNYDQNMSLLVHLGVIRPVSLTDDIDLEADWNGMVYPASVSSTYKSAIAEKLRSQRTAKWGDGTAAPATVVVEVAIGRTGTMKKVPQTGKGVRT